MLRFLKAGPGHLGSVHKARLRTRTRDMWSGC